MKKVIIQELNSKEVKTHSNGKKYMNCGIKTDKWYNGCMWESDIQRFQRLKKGDEIIVEFSQNEKDGKTYDNFRLPSLNQQIDFKLDLILSLMAQPEPLTSEPLPPVAEEEPDDLPF